jgi:hypothetical protein
MPVPWLQIVQLVPSIVDVSRELLKRTKATPPPAERALLPADSHELAARVIALEENERRQAELISKMADQLAGLTRAVTILHRRVIWLSAALAAAVTLGMIAALVAYFAAS